MSTSWHPLFWVSKMNLWNQVQIQLTEYQCFVGRILLPKVTAQWRQAMNPSWCQSMSYRHIEQEHTHEVWYNIYLDAFTYWTKNKQNSLHRYSFVLCFYICISLYIDLLHTHIHTKFGQIFDVLVYKESCLNGVAFACKVIKTLHPSFNEYYELCLLSQLTINWWFGILGIPLSNNPFHFRGS